MLSFFVGYQLLVAHFPSDNPTDSSEIVYVELQGNSITVSSPSRAVVNGSRMTIVSSGTYKISGSLTDGQIAVYTQDDGPVNLIFNGVTINCSTSSPISILDAEEAVIFLEANTQNFVGDGASYVYDSPNEDEPNAAVFSKSDLTFSGEGSLRVIGNYNDGIASKDGLVIQSGTITVQSVDDGIRGRDYIIVKGGSINLNVGGDGLKSDNAENSTLGYISVEDGVISIVSAGDAVQAEKYVLITDGSFNLKSGGGSTRVIANSVSAKSIKGLANVIISGGTFEIDSADDALHSNGTVTVNGGSFIISSGDDAIHADCSVEVNKGDINIAKSVECIEGAAVTINDGNLNITSTKDAIHAIADTQNTNTNSSGNNAIRSNGTVTVNGGFTVLSSGDDAIHADGSVEINGGDIDILHSFEGIESAIVTINDGDINIVSSDDGIDAVAIVGNPNSGIVSIVNGVIGISSGGDAIQAEKNILIADGNFRLTSGGGSNSIISAGASAKGIKASVSVTINGGTFEIDSADDALHSNGVVTVRGGSLVLLSGDETIYADGSVQIAGGDIDVANSSQDPGDEPWDTAMVVDVALNGNSITVSSSRPAVVNGSKLTIRYAGTYRIVGSLNDGQIIVNTKDSGVVKLILNGSHVSCSTSAPICVLDAEDVILSLEAGTENSVSDGTSYIFANPGVDEPNAAIFCRSNLVILGSGSLNVDGNYNDGVASKDGLTIESGNITISAVDDGIRGKDFLVANGGNLLLDVGGDGLKSDNMVDATMGYISVRGGVIGIRSGGDAVDAAGNVLVNSGSFNLVSGGGSSGAVGGVSAKGIKGAVGVTIDAGVFVIDSADDAVHSNGNVAINGGSLVLSTRDDGIHADSSITIKNGEISIPVSYEGIEAPVVTINSGVIHVVSRDDGINIGVDSGFPGPGQGIGFSTYTGNYYLYINGGYLAVNALGDGIDSNGAVVMTGGYVLVDGPSSNMNSALDHIAFNITGGFLYAVGSSGMALPPGNLSTQYSVMLNFRSPYPAGTLIHVQASDGTGIFTLKPTKQYQSVVFSLPSLALGSAYDVYVGGSCTGTIIDGLYSGGTYTPGTKYTSFTIYTKVTRLGPSGGFFP